MKAGLISLLFRCVSALLILNIVSASNGFADSFKEKLLAPASNELQSDWQSTNPSFPKISPPVGASLEINKNPLYNSYTPSDYVQKVLVTGCLRASNVTFAGQQQQIGYFNRGGSNFPISEGIILSTGNVEDAAGPNTDTRKTTSWGPQESDSDLAAVAGVNSIYDKAVLEFDFVPAGNKVEFRYVFASEEYPEYSCTEYNDAFGFFLSGPGINGPFTNRAINIATLPNGDQVSISKIHGVTSSCSAVNANYYLDNPTNVTTSPYYYTTQYDGMTTVITATYPVIPCQTYHIKFAICDIWDNKFDSSVFLQARSFVSEQVIGSNVNTSVPLPDFTNIFEGCSPNYFIINRLADNISEPLDVNLIFGGTAINGTDISLAGPDLPLRPLPSVFTIPANKRADTIRYYAPNNGIADNGKTFTIKMLQSCLCDPNPVYVTKTINIYEKQPFTISVTPVNVKCQGDNTGAILPAVSGGSGLYQYSIDNLTWLPDMQGIPAGTYPVRVQDYGSCQNTVQSGPTVTVGTDSPYPQTNFVVSDPSICAGSTATIVLSGSEASASYQLQIDGTGTAVGMPVSGSGGALNFQVSPSINTTYSLSATMGAGCTKILPDKSVVQVNALPNPGAINPD